MVMDAYWGDENSDSILAFYLDSVTVVASSLAPNSSRKFSMFSHCLTHAPTLNSDSAEQFRGLRITKKWLPGTFLHRFMEAILHSVSDDPFSSSTTLICFKQCRADVPIR